MLVTKINPVLTMLGVQMLRWCSFSSIGQEQIVAQSPEIA
jgi:hypothetical protein